MSQFNITPYGGEPGSLAYIQAPANSNVHFANAKTLYLSPLNPPAGIQAFTIAGATAFGYRQPFSILDDKNISFTVSALAKDPMKGLVPGEYSVILISGVDYMNAGQFLVLLPGQPLPPLPSHEMDWILNSGKPYIPRPKPWYGPGSGIQQIVPYGFAFWYDSYKHPSDDFAYWYDIKNWGKGTWKWTKLNPPPGGGWHITKDPDHRHGKGTSLHGYILAPDKQKNPAPVPAAYPPWPSLLNPPKPMPPAKKPNAAIKLPPLMPGAPLPAPMPQNPPVPSNIQELAGSWHLNLAYLPDEHFRFTAIFQVDANNKLRGILQDEQGLGIKDDLIFHAQTSTNNMYEFSRNIGSNCPRAGQTDIFRVKIESGVLSGIFYLNGKKFPQGPHLIRHVNGWNQNVIDDDNTTPRVWEIIVNGKRGRVRIDGQKKGTGRIKFYKATGGDDLEYDIDVTKWDPTTLVFSYADAQNTYIYTSTKIQGRSISGKVEVPGKVPIPYEGVRVEILTYGILNKATPGSSAWQDTTRNQLYLLMMGGNDPGGVFNGTVTITDPGQDQDDTIKYKWGVGRDDFGDPVPPSTNNTKPPNKYWKFKLVFNFNISGEDFNNIKNPKTTITREVHGCLAIPKTNIKQGFSPSSDLPHFSGVVALNGHNGMLQPEEWMNMNGGSPQNYWYADSFARYGYLSLAIQVVHRFKNDRGSNDPAHQLYLEGPDPYAGTRAIGEPSEASTWADDGERVWDAVRGLNFLKGNSDNLKMGAVISDPYLKKAWDDFVKNYQNKGNIVSVAGHSMGGEVSLMAGALEKDFAAIVSDGNANDFGANFPLNNASSYLPVPPNLHENPNLAIYSLGLDPKGHRPPFLNSCMQWTRANISEYVDLSDFIALSAPRPLIFTSDTQYTWSKQQARRGRVAYNEWNSWQGNFVHHISLFFATTVHRDNGHAFHAGMHGETNANIVPNIYVPQKVGTLGNALDITWQTDESLYLGRTQTPSSNPSQADLVSSKIFDLIP